MGSKGSNTTTNQTQSSPDPNAYAAYLSLLNRASGVAATPYQAYTGEGVAGINPQETAGIGGVNQYAGAAQPAIGQAIGQAATSSAPLTAAGIQQYMSPYTQNVVNTTQAEFNNQNQQALQNIRGNAIAQGALGGNREGVAEGVAAGQQQLAQAPVIAGLYNQGYGQAVNTAEQQQALGLQGAGVLGNLGVAGQTAGLQGAGAQIGAGQLQQNTQQALDTYLAQQYAQQQAYPYQQTQWLAGLDTGVGSQMGGTSQGQTTGPPPNPWSQIAGGITSGVGALGATGAFGSAGWLAPALMALKRGGRVHGVAYEPAPENVHTLAAQQKQLTDGHRVAQLYPKGHPELRLSKGMSRAKMPNGDIFHYDPKRITRELLVHASKTRQENHVLGLGPVSKHEAMHRFAQGEHPVAVVERNGVGTEVRTAAGTHSTAGVQFHHMDAHKSPGHYVSIERPDHTIAARASGGGVAGYADGGVPGIPWAGAPSWIPSNSIVHGSGAPRASAPGVANTGSSDLSKQASQIGQLASQLTNQNNNAYGPTVAGTTPEADATNDYFQDLAAGDAGSASTYGLARGGVAGFDDGGTVPDFDERFPLIKDEGQGTTSIGSPDDYPVGSRFNPYRDVSPDSTQSWRQGVDQPNAAVAADVPESGSSRDLPVSRGVAPSRMAFSGDTSGAPPADLPDEVALGYSGHKSDGVSPPTTDSSSPSSGIDWSSSGKLWPALMSAGFGMLASRSPFFGVAVGEGGQAGLGTYGAEQQREFEAQKYAQQMEHQQREEARLEQQARVSQANQPLTVDAQGHVSINQPYVTAKQQLEKDWQPKIVKAGVNMRGDDVQGIYDPNKKTMTDLSGRPMIIKNGIVQDPDEALPVPPGPQSQNAPPPSVQPQTTPPTPTPQATLPAPNAQAQPSIPSSPANATAGAQVQTPYQVASLGLVPPSHQMPSNAVPYDQSKPVPPATMDNPNTPTPPPPPPQIPPHPADPNAPEGSDASRNTQFLAQIAKQDPALAIAIKKAADYELDPAKYETLYHGARKRFMNLVFQYDPNYHPQEVGLALRAQQAFVVGTKTGDTVRAFNTAVSHLDTLRAAYQAVQNGDWQTFNGLKNRFEAEFGYAPPNTLNAISQIVGGEVVKATVGSQNALGDREELRKTLEPKLSQGQAMEVIKHFQELMGGQLNSLKFAYEQGTHLHNFDEKFLLPRSRQILKEANEAMAKEGRTAGPQTEQDHKALDWANSNPNDPRAAAIKKKLGIQ